MLGDDEPRSPGDGGETSNGHRGEDAFSGKAKALVRLVAGGFMLIGAMDTGLYWFKCQHEQVTPGAWHCVYLSIPLVIGVAILIKTRALARRIEDWLDE